MEVGAGARPLTEGILEVKNENREGVAEVGEGIFSPPGDSVIMSLGSGREYRRGD